MLHVIILCGGRSAEHEVSLVSASSVVRNLDRSRYRISVIGIQKDGSTFAADVLRSKMTIGDTPVTILDGKHWVELLLNASPPAEIVFPVLHGPYGEDGTVQGALEVLDIPYVGAGVWGSAVGMNKIHCKGLLADAGLPVLPYVAINRLQWDDGTDRLIEQATSSLSYPLFVKPANMGSSIGINKSRSREDLIEHIRLAFKYDDFILVEQGIEAREIEVSVLGNLEAKASIAGEIVPSGEFYTYESKYEDASSQLVIPARLSAEQMERGQGSRGAGLYLSAVGGNGSNGLPDGQELRGTVDQRAQHDPGIHKHQHVSETLGGIRFTVRPAFGSAHPVGV